MEYERKISEVHFGTDKFQCAVTSLINAVRVPEWVTSHLLVSAFATRCICLGYAKSRWLLHIQGQHAFFSTLDTAEPVTSVVPNQSFVWDLPAYLMMSISGMDNFLYKPQRPRVLADISHFPPNTSQVARFLRRGGGH